MKKNQGEFPNSAPILFKCLHFLASPQYLACPLSIECGLTISKASGPTVFPAIGQTGLSTGKMIQHLVLSLLDPLLGWIQGNHLDLKMEIFMQLELELLESLVKGNHPRKLAAGEFG